MSERLIRLWPLAAFPVLFYLVLFHPATLDVTNVGWLIRGSDNGENALGLHAWLHDDASAWSLRTTLLNAPEGVALLFTDSNPLIALLAKPFAHWFPANMQLVGPWLLLCLTLQVLFAWLLLRPYAPGPLALWFGVVLLAMPPTLMNRYIHVNLFAHWLILCAIWLFVDRQRSRSGLAWAALLIVTTLVHSYLLIMIAAIWATSVAVTLIEEPRARAGTLAASVATAAAVLAIAVWLGAMGRYESTGTYGYFAMPLDSLWNAANPSYSNLLPTIAQPNGRGMEGFQYLGVGMLVLVPVACGVAWLRPEQPREEDVLRRLLWLLPAFVVLTMLAVSHVPEMAGRRVASLPLPEAIAPFTDMVRASGRLFWPVGYTLVFATLVAAYRLSRERVTLLLAGVLAVQMLDTAGIAEAVRGTSAEAGDRRLFRYTTDPRWDRLIAASHDVAFQPADATLDLGRFQELAWRAVNLDRPVRTVYAARMPVATRERQAREAAEFAAGRLAPDRLYILIDGMKPPIAAGGRVMMIDGLTVIAPLGFSVPR